MDLNGAQVMILNVLVTSGVIDTERKESLLSGRIDDIVFTDLDIDSVTFLDLCVGLEEHIGREFDVDELLEHPSVKKLAGHFTREEGRHVASSI